MCVSFFNNLLNEKIIYELCIVIKGILEKRQTINCAKKYDNYKNAKTWEASGFSRKNHSLRVSLFVSGLQDI